MKHILTFIVCITFILNVYAQESRWGITSSLGVSELAIPIADNQAYELKPSYGLGLVSEIQLINHLSARLGVRYTRKGGQKNIQGWDGFRDVTVSKRAFRLSLIEIPVAVSLDFGKKNGFILTGGIYYGLAFSGKAVRQDRGEPETSESIAFTDTFNPVEGRFQMKGADFKFYFNADKQALELDQNPYGESDLTTISNVISEENSSALKFDLCIVERKWHVFRSAIKNFSFETSDQLPIIK